MGAFRTQIESLGARQFYDGSDTQYSSEAGYTFAHKTFGPASVSARLDGNEVQSSLVKTETNSHITGGFFLSDLRALWSPSVLMSDVENGTMTLTGRFERADSGFGSFGPPSITPNVITGAGTAFEGDTGDRANSNGFLQVQFRASTGGPPGSTIPIGFWDLHVTAGDTIGIATYSDLGWGDLRIDYINPTTEDRWGRRKCYTFDTGYPAGLLFDGRPHLLTVRFRAHNQFNSSTSAASPLPQDNWFKLNIDGTDLGATARGPALTGYDGVPNMTMSTHAWDELAFWDRALSDVEAASMWGTAVWGEDNWPHPGAGFSTASMGHAESVEALTRVVDQAYNFGNPSIRQPQVVDFQILSTDIDPVWEQGWADEVATSTSYDGTRHADMGEATWEGTDPWNSTRDRGLASKWLDMEAEVDLLAVPIVGVATVYATLEALEDQAAGTSSGQSSVSGDLTVDIPLLAGVIQGSSTVYAITIGDLDTLAAASAGTATVSGDLSHGQTEALSAASSGGSSVSGDMSVSRYSLIGGEEVDGNGMPMAPGGRRRSHFTPLSVGRVSDRGQGLPTAGAGVGVDGIGLGS